MTTENLTPFQPLGQNLTPPIHKTPTTPTKLGKFTASQMIIKESWALLRQDKEIMWFPVLSTITSLIALIGMGVLFFYLVLHGDIHAFEGKEEVPFGALEYSLAIVYYTVMFFIVNFFQAGMYIIAHGRMNGADLTFSDGMRGAQEVAGKIFIWSLISATVGVLLRAIADRSKLVGKIVVGLFGAAWNILTFFSLPSLVIGKVSVIDSFKMSADTIRKTWGETIIINIGTGFIFAFLFFIAFVLGFAVIFAAPTTLVIVSVCALFFVFMLTISVVFSALGAIFKLALFEYARTGIVPKGFSPELIQNAVQR